MQCPHCQEPVPQGAVYCGACGRRVIGWRGTARGEAGRSAVDSSEETRKVPPDPRLLEAAGRDAAAARCMAPDSHVLKVIRRDADPQEVPTDSGSAHRADRGGPAGVEGGPTSPASSPRRGGPSEDTAYFMEAALRGGRSRLTVLLVADACLLLVGVYLIVSWARQPPRRSLEPPPRSTGAQGYISWEDDGKVGSIATGPVVATFQGRGSPSAGQPGLRPGSGVDPREAGRPVRDVPSELRPQMDRPRPTGEPRPRLPGETRPRGAGPRDVGKAPPTQGPPREARPVEAPLREVAEAAEQLRVFAARDRFLKEIPGKVRGHQKEIRRCYQQVMTLRKGVQGDVDVEFEVALSGAVSRAHAGRNTTGSAALGSCVAGVFLRMRFSAPPGGAVVLRYPFRFSPQSR